MASFSNLLAPARTVTQQVPLSKVGTMPISRLAPMPAPRPAPMPMARPAPMPMARPAPMPAPRMMQPAQRPAVQNRFGSELVNDFTYDPTVYQQPGIGEGNFGFTYDPTVYQQPGIGEPNPYSGFISSNYAQQNYTVPGNLPFEGPEPIMDMSLFNTRTSPVAQPMARPIAQPVARPGMGFGRPPAPMQTQPMARPVVRR